MNFNPKCLRISALVLPALTFHCAARFPSYPQLEPQFILLFNLAQPAPAPASQSTVCSLAQMGGGVQGCDLSLSGTASTPFGPPQGASTVLDTDATGNAARFNGPRGLATDGSHLFVADTTNNKIRTVDLATGAVTTLAGPAPGASTSGDTDGIGNAARFTGPVGITTDGVNLYVAEATNNKIRKIVISTGVVSTIAGPAAGSTLSGDTDATGNASRFNGPRGITTDGTNLYVADSTNNKIRKIVIASGVVSTIAGPAPGTTTGGDTDAVGNSARFLSPSGITTDGTSIYVADTNNNKIRQIVLSTGAVTTIAGPPPGITTSSDTDATGNAARFNAPFAITTDSHKLFVADSNNQRLRQVEISSGAVTTLAGPAQGSTGSGDIDGVGSVARFVNPLGITADAQGLFVGDTSNSKIRRIR